MCQMTQTSMPCAYCGGGYCAGLGNYLPHNKDCPAETSDRKRMAEIDGKREQRRRESVEID